MRSARYGIAALLVVVAAATGWYLYSLRQARPPDAKPVALRLQSFALSLHPLKMADVESRQVATLLHAGLVFQDQDGKVTPLLASSWTQSGNSWTFALRRDATFSNGAPVTAADVTASLCAAMQPASPWAWALLSIEHRNSADGKARECTGISAPDSGSVRIVETAPVPWLLDAIGGPAGWVLPATGLTEQAYGVVPGAGPYAVKEIVPDVRVVLEARRDGSPIAPGSPSVHFDYLPDDAVAAQRFAQGRLDVLDLTSPQMVSLVVDPGSRNLRFPGTLVEKPWDRVRIVIVNERSLSDKGFAGQQIRDFIDALSANVDRARLVASSNGTAEALLTAFPPAAGLVPIASRIRAGEGVALPRARLTILTEADAYSDLIAASLPRQIGDVAIDYKGVDKGILLQSLFKGEYDLASIVIEATVKSPMFWSAFFTPGNPYAVLGKPLAGMEKVNFATESGVADAARLIAEGGNWVPLLREKRIQAIAPGISGIAYSPSGQTNFASIRKD